MSEPRLGSSIRSSADSPWWGIHAARYEFAARTLVGRTILDVACGTGYGLEVLAAPTRKVFGVDADSGALQEASRHGSALAADGKALPFADHTFDSIISFETIEHLHHRDQFLAELARVLVPGGALILSTPNAKYTRPVNGKPKNPHHVHEYEPDELRKAIENDFVSVQMLGQVINSRFIVSPFIEDQERLERTPRVVMRWFGWRLLNRLPSAIRDRVSYVAWGHPLYPSEHDYEFLYDAVDAAPVLMVVARRAS